MKKNKIGYIIFYEGRIKIKLLALLIFYLLQNFGGASASRFGSEKRRSLLSLLPKACRSRVRKVTRFIQRVHYNFLLFLPSHTTILFLNISQIFFSYLSRHIFLCIKNIFKVQTVLVYNRQY